MYKIGLSPYAKIFYNEWLLEPSGSRYNLSIDQTLHDLNPKRLKAALKKYVTEHVLLNSHVQETSGQPFWVKNDEIYELEYSDATGLVDTAATDELYSYVSHGFDLHRGPLYRFKLLRVGKKAYRFIMVMHHLIMDGSASLDPGVFTAIANYYNNENYTTKYSISEQIALITTLEKNLSTRLEQNRAKYQKFWHKQLSDVEGVDLTFLKLGDESAQHKNTEEIPGTIGEIKFSYDGAKLKELNQVKSKYGITPYIYGLSIFASLLHRYTGQESLAISYPISIKDGKESVDFIYGSQINTNLIPYRFDKTTTIVDLFKQGQEFFRLTIRDDTKHGYCPITDIIQKVDNKKLLNICFAQTFFREKPLELYGITNTKVHTELRVDGVAKDIFLFEQDARSSKEQLDYRVRYDKRTINDGLLNNFIASYKRLFSEILDDLLNGSGDRSISSYNILDAKQYQKIVYEFNQTERDYPRNKTIHALFEEQVLKNPDKLAVVYEDKKLTYQELNQKANQLANYLLTNYGIRPDDLVVLCLDRSEQILIAMLGVLKAGGAYVPVDPGYPDERIGYILGDTKAKVVLTNRVYGDKLRRIAEQKVKGPSVDIITIDDRKVRSKLAKQGSANLATSTKSTDLIYVIYTSGTTGQPKGVMVEHRSLVNFIDYAVQFIKVNDITVSYINYSFDAINAEIYPALLKGNLLHVLSDGLRANLDELYQYLVKHGITFIVLPSAVATELSLNYDLNATKLKGMVVGGDIYRGQWSKKIKIINQYGPTEATVCSALHQYGVSDIYTNIGKPISNTTHYVLDKDLSVLPIGAIGELFIGGDGLARGYLNLPELTKDKFIFNPFQTRKDVSQNKNNRLYKTGDLVRMFPDGDLEYRGRNDFQVKIRGYRIELGEIERALACYPGVRQTVVLAKKHVTERLNDIYLAAYYVADRELDELKIQYYLAKRLPEYVLPTALVHVNKLPLAINGKLDRNALPEPKFSYNRYVVPSNEQESLICEKFAKVLGIERIGINDDFFKLGGNSLKAIALTYALQTNFDVKVADIFNLRTPKRLARTARSSNNVLRKKLECIKLSYQENQNVSLVIDKQPDKVERYLKNVAGLQADYSVQKPISSVLLTGVTGYLGCNIFNQLLELTSYTIFLLIRADSEIEAINRINKKYQFYFDKTLDASLNSRVFVIKADIEKNNLGLSPEEYRSLSMKVDSVVHAAALIKHYGEYDKFYLANVQTTTNLLEFSKLTDLKDFHYISTYSVLDFGYNHDHRERTYTEDDMPDGLKGQYNVYVKTKLQGEHQAVRYRDYGVKSSIYRLGNLAFMMANHRVQDNIAENAFFNWIKYLFRMRCVARDISKVEISPVDSTARAVVKLFDKKYSDNNIYHVFNPYLFDLSDFATTNGIYSMKVLTMGQFIDKIIDELNRNIDDNELTMKFLLRHGWLDKFDIKRGPSIKIMQNRTQYILEQLGFVWTPISCEVFNKYLRSSGL